MKPVSLLRIRSIFGLAMAMAIPAFAQSPRPLPVHLLPVSVIPAPPRLVVQGAEIPVRLESMAVTTQIVGRLAQTSVELVFFNPNARQLEGELQFPLLDGQEITGFAMDFDGKLREAVPVEKARGRAVFEDITRARVDPALAEKTIGNNFKLRVYPLFARAKKIVVVRYEEALAERGGSLTYRLPLIFGEKVGRFSWTGNIASGAAPRHIRGPMGDIRFARAGNGYALDIERRDVQLSGVVELAVPAQGMALAATQEFDGAVYFYSEPAIGTFRASPRATPKRIAIYWDASGSGSDRDHAREFALLGAYFDRFRNLEVELVQFRDTTEEPRRFTVANGDWASLRRVLEAAVYDGGSNFAPLARIAGVDEALVFSDGIANYGETAVPKIAVRTHVIGAAARSDAAFLRALAEQSGGRYVDTLKTGGAAAAALLGNQAPRASIASTEGVADALLGSPFAENGRLQIAGRLTETEGRVVLHIDSGGGKPVVLTVPIHRAPGGAGFAARRWAALRVAALEADYDLNRAQVERLGKRFRLITRGTSLIILDNAQDYARFDIEPPAELRAEYERLRSAGVRSREADRSAHLERVVRQFREKQAWWERDFPKGEMLAVQEAEKAQGPGEMRRERPAEAVQDRADSLRRNAPAQEMALRPAPAKPAASPVAPAPAAAAPSRNASSSVGIRGTTLGAAGSASAALDGNGSPAATIRLQPFAPDSAYARRLRDADAAILYRIYLDERATHQNSTAFFLDVAELLFEKNEKALALRVLSNLAEMNLEDRHILRILGYRLMQAGDALAALPVFRRVRDLSPDEPQSYRDLGLAYAAAGQTQRAVDALTEVVTRPWHDRFPGIELIALAELNAIVARSAVKLDLARLDSRLIRNLPLDLRVVLAWDADNTDIDLYVTDPNGDTAFYGHRLTFQGGSMSPDFTGGYGPEEFSLKHAKPGKYRVEAQFFGHRQQVVAGATTLMLKLATRFGTGEAREQAITLRLKGNGSKVFVGEFEVGGA